MKQINKIFTKSLLVIAPLITIFSHANSYAKEVHNCNAPVVIPDQGVVINLLQGNRKHRYLDAVINDVSARAVVDTAGMGIGGLVTEELIETMSIAEEKLQRVKANGAHGSSNANRVTMRTTRLGDARVDNLMFMTTKEPVMKGDDASVLIGSRFLCQFLVQFDFENDALTLHDRKTAIEKIVTDNEKWVSADFDNFYNTGGIILPMELNGKLIKAALDTGSPYTGINWKAAELAGVNKESKSLKQYRVLPHSLNATETVLVNESGFSLSLANNNLTRFDEMVRINDIHSFKQLFGDQPGMILGLPFFEGRKLVIDYENSKLYFSESSENP